MTSSYLPPAFQRAKKAIGRTRFSRKRDEEAQELASDAMEASGPAQISLAQRVVEHYPLAVEAWGVLGYHYLNDTIGNHHTNLQASVGVEAARKVDPSLGPDQTEPLEWGIIENRPYIRITILNYRRR